VLVFLDTISQPEIHRKIIKLFEKIALKFLEKVNFLWTDGFLNPDLLKKYGITHKKLPAIA